MSDAPIADYALLSDCHWAALVSRQGSLDWLCFPGSTGPRCFARLLDDAAGHWSHAQALAGEVERARATFERAIAFVNDVVLLSEEVDQVTGELLGNFPPGVQPHRAGQRGVGDHRGRSPGGRRGPTPVMRGRDYFAEFAGTFLLLLIGLSAVVLNFARTSPIPRWLPDGNLRRLLTGMIFAGGATAAHAVRLMWGHLATDVDLGTTIPGRGGWPASFAAEIAITFMLVTLILRFVDEPRLQRFTPAAAGALVAFLVFVEAPVSGTSLNPGPEPRPRLGRRHVLGNLDLRGGAAPWGPPRGRRLPAPESLREVREACPLGQICMPVHRLRIHAPGEAAAGCASSPRS